MPAETISRKERIKAHGPGSEAKKFVNIAWAREGSESLSKVCAKMAALGYTASVVPGPLLTRTMAGKGGKRLPSLMPLGQGAVSGVVGRYRLAKH